MPAYKLNASVVLFNHPEYEQTLLFKHGIANHRDILAKNGVAIYPLFSFLFDRTVQIDTQVIDESSKATIQKLNINCNNLIKYIGENEHTPRCRRSSSKETFSGRV